MKTRINCWSAVLLLESCLGATSVAPAVALSTAANTSTIEAVCTPTNCIQGANILNAGTTIVGIINGTLRSTILLPGTYTSAASLSNPNTSSFLNFDSSAISTVATGFSGTGSITGVYSVALLSGMVTYGTAFYEGIAAYFPLSSLNITSSTGSSRPPISSFLLSDNSFAILSLSSATTNSSRLVVWNSLSDINNLPAGSGNGVKVLDLQSSSCAIPCASGGSCDGIGGNQCACRPGFVGATCNACAPGFFGSNCSPCPAGCTNCDQGITGSGRCILPPIVIKTASECNCINGVCASDATSAICACNAGWGPAANGTQCGACLPGFYPSAAGDCLACDPTCASCTGPKGTCTTCQGTLSPLSTDATKCIAGTYALKGVFADCPARTFYSATNDTCVDCNPLCNTCYDSLPGTCLSCRLPNVLLGGTCVPYSSKTGLCDSQGITSGGKAVQANAGWVLDNQKAACDALPAKCTAGAIDNFTSASTRSQLTCSACLAGSFLSGGKCLSSCPTGTTASTDGKSCIACDPSCTSCSSPTFCTVCAITSKITLNGTCIPGPTCPAGFFLGLPFNSTTSPSNITSSPSLSTCLPCHPDCATCGPTFDKCLTCPPTRPVLSTTSTCVQTCSSSQYYDTIKGSCQACSSNCGTCSGAGDTNCLSCGPTTTLSKGSCKPAGCSSVLPNFGVCHSSLVTLAPPIVSTPAPTVPTGKTVLPWWTILLIVLGVSILIAILALMWRRKEQKRRRLQTARFANDLGKNEVDLKLRAMDPSIAYPSIPVAHDFNEYDHEPYRGRQDSIPLTPPFLSRMEEEQERVTSRWSTSTYGGGKAPKFKKQKAPPVPIIPQDTGGSAYSQQSTASGASGGWGSKNPFNRAI